MGKGRGGREGEGEEGEGGTGEEPVQEYHPVFDYSRSRSPRLLRSCDPRACLLRRQKGSNYNVISDGIKMTDAAY